MQVNWLGTVSFENARTVQTELILARQREQIADCWILCEHPPTVSLGVRAMPDDYSGSWAERGFEVVRADRGGGVTLHLPGQLLCYPVVSLSAAKVGVKTFVSSVLAGIAKAISPSRCQINVSPSGTGVWLAPEDGDGSAAERHVVSDAEAKIAFVGLKIRRGVTDHGFSINICCDPSPFSWITPCGDPTLVVGSLQPGGGRGFFNCKAKEVAAELTLWNFQSSVKLSTAI